MPTSELYADEGYLLLPGILRGAGPLPSVAGRAAGIGHFTYGGTVARPQGRASLPPVSLCAEKIYAPRTYERSLSEAAGCLPCPAR